MNQQVAREPKTGIAAELAVVDLDRRASDQLRRLALSVKADHVRDTDAFFKQAVDLAAELPPLLLQALERFADGRSGHAALLIRPCPLDDGLESQPTPSSGSTAVPGKSGQVSESVLAMTAARLGCTIAYQQIDDGDLFHDIVPMRRYENDQSYASSTSELLFHTEQHFHPYTPDFLQLLCLRSDAAAMTSWVGVRSLLTALSDRSRGLLFQPLYRSGIDHVFGNTEVEKGNGPVYPVLSGDADYPVIRYDHQLMLATTDEAAAALAELAVVMEKLKQGVCLQAGDLLIVDNRHAVHGRTTFDARYDGSDRWLQRSKVIRDTALIGDDLAPDGRTITTWFEL